MQTEGGSCDKGTYTNMTEASVCKECPSGYSSLEWSSVYTVSVSTAIPRSGGRSCAPLYLSQVAERVHR